MKEINWLVILQKPEFYEYLTISDIVELSLVNIFTRDILKSILYPKFNIIKFFYNINKKYIYILFFIFICFKNCF